MWQFEKRTLTTRNEPSLLRFCTAFRYIHLRELSIFTIEIFMSTTKSRFSLIQWILKCRFNSLKSWPKSFYINNRIRIATPSTAKCPSSWFYLKLLWRHSSADKWRHLSTATWHSKVSIYNGTAHEYHINHKFERQFGGKTVLASLRLIKQ
jgi:hypothetical protein